MQPGIFRHGVPATQGFLMATNLVSITRRGFGETARRDFWWAQPLITFIVFGSFIVYSTWAAFQGEHYSFGPYLSPMYSPLIWEAAGSHCPGIHGWVRGPSWLPLVADTADHAALS